LHLAAVQNPFAGADKCNSLHERSEQAAGF